VIAAAALAAAMAVRGGGGPVVSDDLFWGALPDDLLYRAAPQGLSLLAPARVELGRRATLPVAVRRRASLRDDARAPLGRFGVLIAVDPERNQLWVGRVAQPDDDVPAFQPPSDAELDEVGDGATTQVARVELREQLKLPWRPAHLRILAALHDKRSEVHAVLLEGAGDGQEPAQPEPVDAPSSREPAAPAKPGVVLATKGSTLHGGLRSGTPDKGAAIVHLVCVFEDDGFPVHLAFRVPLHGGTGGFALGPKELAPLNPGRPVWVWAFERALVSGPVRYVRPP
jgi:hypothetical protein